MVMQCNLLILIIFEQEAEVLVQVVLIDVEDVGTRIHHHPSVAVVTMVVVGVATSPLQSTFLKRARAKTEQCHLTKKELMNPKRFLPSLVIAST